MKIDKIQCDICGKVVDYNDIPVNELGKWPNEDAQKFKINKITLNGIRVTSTAPFSFIGDHIKPVFIHMEYDLCEKCLEKIYALINKIKNEGDHK